MVRTPETRVVNADATVFDIFERELPMVCVGCLERVHDFGDSFSCDCGHSFAVSFWGCANTGGEVVRLVSPALPEGS
jgi:hypothetical protein